MPGHLLTLVETGTVKKKTFTQPEPSLTLAVLLFFFTFKVKISKGLYYINIVI